MDLSVFQEFNLVKEGKLKSFWITSRKEKKYPPILRVSKRGLKAISRALYKYFQAEKLTYNTLPKAERRPESLICKGSLDSTLISKVRTPSFTDLVLEVNASGRPVGIALITIDKHSDEQAYVELLCSNLRGTGTVILDRLKEYMISESAPFDTISLDAVTEALPFYKKQGFDYAGLVPMEYTLESTLKGGTRRVLRTRRRMTRKG